MKTETMRGGRRGGRHGETCGGTPGGRHGGRLAQLVVLCLVALVTRDAHAHATGASYLRVVADQGEDTRISATWDIAAADLELPLQLDANADGEFSANEIAAKRAAIARFAIQRLQVRRGVGEAAAACTLVPGAVMATQRGAQTAAQAYVSLRLDGDCPTRGPLEVQTSLFFGSVSYSLLLDAQTAHAQFSAALTMASDGWTEPPASSSIDTLLRFLSAGVWHVAIGYDHVAFLLLLLLPSVLRGSRSGWAAATSLRGVASDLARIVTAFTVAHSVTLGVAATGTVHVPARPIEVAIAGSIVVAGLLNLFPSGAAWRLRLAFAFGLVHGFGFANALKESGVGEARIAPMLAGFNLGVEVAQLAIVALTLPLLWRLSRTQQYSRRLMPALSVVTAMTGAVWFVSRLWGQA
jgi:hypothetical protein